MKQKYPTTFQFITVEEAGLDWKNTNAIQDYGYVDGYLRGYNFEFQHKDTKEIRFGSARFVKGSLKKDLDESLSVKFEGTPFSLEALNGYFPTGRAIFRGYYTSHYDYEERENYVKEASLEVEKMMKKSGFVPKEQIDTDLPFQQNMKPTSIQILPSFPVYGVEQANHGHLYRWIFTEEQLEAEQIKPFNESQDILWPIGGSNSSATFMKELSTISDVEDFLQASYTTEYADPMLVDIAEGIVTIETNDYVYGASTSQYVQALGIHGSQLTKCNPLYPYAEALIDTIKLSYTEEQSGIDYDNPFYGSSKEMRLSELEDLVVAAKEEEDLQNLGPSLNM